MRASDPATHAISAIENGLGRYFADADRRRVRELRRAIANRIEADIALLDALAGDCDLEENGDAEPSLGAQEVSASGCYVVSYYTVNPTTSQVNWGASGADDREQDAGDDREEENEHGGNILDEPHDPQADDIQKGEHRWDPAMAGMARAARRQAEALRARMNRRGRA